MLVVWLEDEDGGGFSPGLGMSDSNGEMCTAGWGQVA